jgi:hypothetical protein
VFWNEAVPCTVKFLETIKSCWIVTSLGKLIVTLFPEATAVISLAVPKIPKVSVLRSIAILPVEPEIFKVLATPVKPEPSPVNEPVNEPVATASVNVNPATAEAEAPNVIVVEPSKVVGLTNLALVT